MPSGASGPHKIARLALVAAIGALLFGVSLLPPGPASTAIAAGLCLVTLAVLAVAVRTMRPPSGEAAPARRSKARRIAAFAIATALLVWAYLSLSNSKL